MTYAEAGVDIEAGDALVDLAELDEAFHQEHQRTYSHMARGEPVGIVSIRVVATVPMTDGAAPTRLQRAESTSTEHPVRDVHFGPAFGVRATPILRRSMLGTRSIAGPLIVEEYDSTCVVPPDAKVAVDEWQNIIMTFGN
jgi:N-methylhydantoinase A